MQFYTSSFKRRDASFRTWLQRLAAPDPPVHSDASKAVYEIVSGIQGVDLDMEDAQFDFQFDGHQHRRVVQNAIFEFLGSKDVEVSEYLHALEKIQMNVRAEQHATFEALQKESGKTDSRVEALTDRIAAELSDCNNEERRGILLSRLRRIICASGPETDAAPLVNIDQMFVTQAVETVFSSVDTFWSEAPGILRRYLQRKDSSEAALDWIIAMGDAAQPWLPTLLELFEQIDPIPTGSSKLREAILAAGEHDESLNDWLAWQMSSGNALQRRDALFMVAARSEDTYPLIFEAVQQFGRSPDFCWQDLNDLASIGRHHRFIRLFIIDLAKPSPPDFKEQRHGDFVERINESMWMRSYGLHALSHLGGYINEFKGVILDAMDSFVEFDPDYCYDGPHGRISEVIEILGPAASCLAVEFASRLTDATEEGEFAGAMLDALDAIEEGAIEALPLMQQYREATFGEEDESPQPIDGPTIDRYDDRVGSAMQSIYRAANQKPNNEANTNAS